MSKRSRPILSIPNYFRRHSGHANGLFIKAGVRKGKTTLASAFTKQLLKETEFYIASNVRFENEVYDDYQGIDGYPARLKYITSDLEYFEYYVSIPDDKPMLLVWDDAQASEGFQSTEQYTDSAKMLQKFLINIGKMETSFIYVCHRSYIPRSLSEGFEPLYIHILKRGSFYITEQNYDSGLEIKKAVQRGNGYYVPLPSWDTFKQKVLPILTRAPASFEFILDHGELQKILTRWDIGEDLKRGIREFLNMDSSSESQEDKELRVILGASYEKLFLALCLKRKRLISGGEKFKEVINPTLINDARQKAKKIYGLK